MQDHSPYRRADLTALIGSRICHDLISPIGAIGNGVELLMMEAGANGAEYALIAESVAQANARIRLFRVAFGATGGEDTRLSARELSDTIDDMTRGGRLSIAFDGPSDLSRREVKVAYLVLMCLESAMPFGGKITVTRGPLGWNIAGVAPRLRIDAALWDMFNGAPCPDVTPGQVHFPLLVEEVARQHRKMTVTRGEEEISFRF